MIYLLILKLPHSEVGSLPLRRSLERGVSVPNLWYPTISTPSVLIIQTLINHQYNANIGQLKAYLNLLLLLEPVPDQRDQTLQ